MRTAVKGLRGSTVEGPAQWSMEPPPECDRPDSITGVLLQVPLWGGLQCANLPRSPRNPLALTSSLSFGTICTKI